MPSLTIWIDPPDDWEESVVFSSEEGVSHRLTVSGKLAPFRRKVVPEESGGDSIHIDIVNAEKRQSPYVGISRHEGAYAWVPVDMPALTWIREQWRRGGGSSSTCMEIAFLGSPSGPRQTETTLCGIKTWLSTLSSLSRC
jgi:hypothetical protein